MDAVEVSKTEVAKRQIDAAIKLYIEDGDIISMHTLVSAAHDVLVDIARARGLDNVYDNFEKMVRPEMLPEWRKTYKEAQNFFKHADKDSDKKLKFKKDIADLKLHITCLVYQQVNGSIEPLQQAFLTWYSAENPRIILAEHQSRFVNMAQMMRLMSMTKKSFFAEYLTLFNKNYPNGIPSPAKSN